MAFGNVRVNLMSNPAFEVDDGFAGWTTSSSTISRNTTQQYAGSACLQFVANYTTGDTTSSWYQVFAPPIAIDSSVVEGFNYGARIRYSGPDSATVTAFIGLRFFDSGMNLVGPYLGRFFYTTDAGNDFSASWRPAFDSYSDQIPAGTAYVQLCFGLTNLTGIGTLYVDNMLLEPCDLENGFMIFEDQEAPTPTWFDIYFDGNTAADANSSCAWLDRSNGKSYQVVKSLTNMAATESMENGSTSGWSTSGASIANTTAYAHEGTRSLQATPAAVGTTGWWWTPYYPAAAGDIIVMRAMVMTMQATSDSYGFYIECDSSSAYLRDFGGYTGVLVQGKWGPIGGPLICPSGAYEVGVTFGNYDTTTTASRFVDNVSLFKLSSSSRHYEIAATRAFSGDTPDVVCPYTGIVTSFAWTGTPHASTSTATADPNSRTSASAFFNFDIDAQGWTASGSGSTAARTTGVGENSSAALQASLSGKSKSGTATFTWTGTWADLGIPAGKVVTLATLSSIWLNTSAYTTAGATNSWDLSLTAGGSTYPLMTTQTATGTGVKTVPAQSGVAVSGGASDPVTLTLTMTQSTGNSTSAAVTMQADSIALNLKFTTPVLGNASFSGSGALTGVGKKVAIVTGNLSSSGSLTTSGAVPRVVGSTNLSSSGALTTTAARITTSGSRALSGGGTLAATGSPGAITSGTLSGSGALTATGQKLAESHSGTGNTFGSGALAATGVPRPAPTLALASTGALSGNLARLTLGGSAATAGSGALSGAPTRLTQAGSAALAGAGTLAVTPHPGFTDALNLVGSGALTGTPWYSGTTVAVGGTASGTGWVNTSAATGSDDSSFATWTSSTPSAVSDALVVAGFGTWDSLPADADIQKVTVRVKGYSD